MAEATRPRDRDAAAVPEEPRTTPRRTGKPDPLDRIESAAERTLAKTIDKVAKRFHLRSWATARFGFPLVMLAAGAVAISLLTLDHIAATWIFIGAYAAPIGNELAITGALVGGLEPLVILAIVLWIDFWAPLFLVWNLDLLLRVPRLGPWLGRIETKMQDKWARHRILRDLGVIGLAVFVWVPGSGPTPGCIVGRFAGFPWALVWLAVFVGSAVRAVAYTLAAAGILKAVF